jgi:hypothetical protein
MEIRLSREKLTQQIPPLSLGTNERHASLVISREVAGFGGEHLEELRMESVQEFS